MTHGSRSMRRRIVEEALVLVSLVAAVTFAKYQGWLNPIERFVVDVFVAQGTGRPMNHTMLFDIDDDSYAKVFGSVSPLAPDKLAALIGAAFEGGARAVVVDVDTDETAVLAALTKESVPYKPDATVWARLAVACGESLSCVRPVRPLTPHHGIALLVHDGDGRVRRHQPTFGIAPVNGPCACGNSDVPSLGRAALRAAKGAESAPSSKPLLLSWSGDRTAIPRIAASQVLQDRQKPFWKTATIFNGRVVLIGGTFTAGRDKRWTPVGQMDGLEVLAHIVENEFDEGGMKQFGLVGSVVLELISGLALIALNWRFPAGTRLSLLLNAFVVLALPIAASFLLYRYSLFWVNVAPVLVGVWIHQWHTRAHALTAALAASRGVAHAA